MRHVTRFAIILISLSVYAAPQAGNITVSWSNPIYRADGSEFVSNELIGTRITYTRSKERHTQFVPISQPTRVTLTNLKKGGWWTVYLEAVSNCYILENRVFSEDICYSQPTQSLMTRAR